MEKKSTKIAYFVALGIFIVLLVVLGISYKDAPILIEGATTPFAGTFWSLLPPIVAIVLALISKEVYSSLFLGCLVGALLVSNFAPWETLVQLVEGDIHDIGKNLVVLMLKNYGYNVIDMGKDVPCEDIVNKAIETNASVIGLSALMTTTMMRMKDVVEICKEKGCKSKVVIGGACITQSFADEIGADGYSKDAAECVKLVERLLNS